MEVVFLRNLLQMYLYSKGCFGICIPRLSPTRRLWVILFRRCFEWFVCTRFSKLRLLIIVERRAFKELLWRSAASSRCRIYHPKSMSHPQPFQTCAASCGEVEVRINARIGFGGYHNKLLHKEYRVFFFERGGGLSVQILIPIPKLAFGTRIYGFSLFFC